MSTNNSNHNHHHHLAEYLSFESKQQQSSRSSDDTPNDDIGRHALDQLLECKLGNELTSCAQRLLAINNNDNGISSSSCSSSVLEEEVTKLMDTPAFQQIHAQITECPVSLLLPSKQIDAEDDDNLFVGSSNKNTKEESTATAATNKPAAAATITSFSLFDLMDSQKGGSSCGGAFTFPPRIMAHQIIDAYQRDNNTSSTTTTDHHTNNNNDTTIVVQNNNVSSSDNISKEDTTQQLSSSTNNNNNNNKSAVELLEQAEDMEDLSPNVDSWEGIRSILYRGLTTRNETTNDVEEEEERCRYFQIHKSLFDKCRRNGGGGGGGGGGVMMMFRSQTWGLIYNIVGCILNDSEQMTDLDLYWDSCHFLLSSLSHLAMEYITSCVGYEKEIDRMILGLCYILCTDASACVLAIMEPMAGWFEVWARFVGPSKLLTILRVSGLGEVVMRRCESRGRNEASKRLHEMMRRHRDNNSSESSPTLEDLENSNFLQSLSILRVIMMCRCNVMTLESMGSMFCYNAVISSSFLSADGIASSDEVQTMLGKAKNDEMEGKEKFSSSVEVQKEITARVLKPFRDVILLKESTPGLVNADLELLCTQTVSLVESSCVDRRSTECTS